MLKKLSDDLETIKSNIVKNWGKKHKKKGIFVSHTGNDNNNGRFFSPLKVFQRQ